MCYSNDGVDFDSNSLLEIESREITNKRLLTPWWWMFSDQRCRQLFLDNGFMFMLHRSSALGSAVRWSPVLSEDDELSMP